MESINIIEEKLNIEVVYYVQQFYTFVKEWKTGNSSPKIQPNLNEDVNEDEDENAQRIEEEEEEEDQGQGQDDKVQGIELVDDGKQDKSLISELQIDSMMNNPDMDEVDLDSSQIDIERMQRENDAYGGVGYYDVDVNGNNGDNEEDEEDENVNIDEIEISENHDVET